MHIELNRIENHSTDLPTKMRWQNKMQNFQRKQSFAILFDTLVIARIQK